MTSLRIPARGKRASPEEALHRTVASYLAHALPWDAWFTTIPAGGGGRVRGSKLKGMSYKAGTPDLIIVHEGRALWIELKAPKGRLSDEQSECHALLDQAGAEIVVARSVDDIETALRKWNVPLKARAA